MCHQNIMGHRHIEKHALPTLFMTKHASPSDAFDVLIHFPILLIFHTRGLKHNFFPSWKSTKFQSGKRGGIVSTIVFRPTTQWALGPKARLACDVWWPKPTYHIKIEGHYLDRSLFVKAKVSPQRPASGRLV